MHLVQEEPERIAPGPARVALVGAFDRFPFGDLLFPAVLERRIGDGCQAPIDFCNAECGMGNAESKTGDGRLWSSVPHSPFRIPHSARSR
jgi:hypothetical protein